MRDLTRRSSPQDLVIVGSGGFGREVADVVRDINASGEVPTWNLLGYLDDAPSSANVERVHRQGLEILGAVEPHVWPTNPHFVVGINDARVRRRIADRLEWAGWSPATLIHPTASIGSDCRIGAGTIMCPGSRITTNVQLGRHVHLNPNCTVGHDTTLCDFVSVNPQAAISGNVLLESGVVVGAAAFILQGLVAGADCTIGASSCVTKSVPADAVVKGVPAR
ncbi:acetyltransferase [Micrococcus sp. IITD107]|uniref:acetyltransferase n=1 Tax=Micrococcus sp. IITD107 TaxID=3342790 RepID=UPI0035B87B74